MTSLLRRMGLAVTVIICCSLFASGQISAPGPVKRKVLPSPVLTVGGLVTTPLNLTSDDLAKLPRRTARGTDQAGKEIVYEGVALADVLKLAGVEFGTMLKGNSLGLFVVAEAVDKFRVVFAIPELDPAYTDRVIIIADRQDGRPLDPMQGPLQLVVPDEKRHARWVRQVTALTIRRAE